MKRYPSDRPSGVSCLGEVPAHCSVVPSRRHFAKRKLKAALAKIMKMRKELAE